MLDEALIRMTVALAEASSRRAAALELAAHLGASALLLLVEDAAVGALLPVPGMPQTLPGGAPWRAFLRLARAPGVHEATLGYPTADNPVGVLAGSADGVVAVLVGSVSTPPSRESLDRLRPMWPLLAAMLRAEQSELAARGELAVAQNHARESNALLRSLDGARSELERTMIELDHARNRAEEATRAKDEFLAMLGHELRNPLSPILTALQLLRLKQQASREIEVIERQVANLMQLVDDLLDVSRITRGKIELRKRPIELAEVAARAIEMSSPVLEKKQQILAVDVPVHGLLVNADPSRLAQVLANLLTNAAKYSDSQSRIAISAESHDGHVRVKVTDEGIGIEPAMLGVIFDLFVQNRQTLDRSQGGLGLGLAIARSLVGLHGGTLRAHSAGVNRGSEFVVELPRLWPAVTMADDEGTPAAQPRPPESAATERVLVVDDNDDAVTLLAEALEAMGYIVRSAPDGPTALRADEEFGPHVALLDLGLPVMDGFELALRLPERPRAAPIRLVAVSGYGRPEDRRRTREVGFDAHLVKPVDLKDLEEVLASFRRPGASTLAQPPP